MHLNDFCLFSSRSILTPSPAQEDIILRVPQYDSGCAQGFFLLKGSFSLPLLLVGGQGLGFCKAPRNNFDVICVIN